ncbi:hypothetical protein HZA33_05340 [Candidatus Pacearchaeota archaeon]|nr:hypothetical protein [Candidatus Pacearchaeota archaeon]
MAKESKENIIIALLIIIIIVLGASLFLLFKKLTNSGNGSFENVVYPKGAGCEELIDYFAKEKNLDIRQPVCTHYYEKDEVTGKSILKRCMCNIVYCDYTLYGRIKGIKECEMKQIEVNTTLIGEITGGQFVK